MFRFVLAGYFCVTVVLGPQLCCCALAQSMPATETESKSCCRKAPSETDRSICSHSLSGMAKHDRHRSAAQPQSGAPKNARSQLLVRHNRCSCNRNELPSQAITAAGGKSKMVRGWDHSSLVVNVLAMPVGTLADASQPSSALRRQLASPPPTMLAGREILLAYQILRC